MTHKKDNDESIDGFGSADVAQNLPEYDELGANEFATRLVRPVLDWPTRYPVVIGLFGAWGSGKTTILNYLDAALRNAKDSSGKAPVVIPFNPWLYQTAESLLEDFFRSLSNAYGKSDGLSSEARRSLLDGITKFGSKAASFAPTGDSKLVALLVKLSLPTVANWVKKAFGGLTLRERRDAARSLLLQIGNETAPRAVVLVDDLDRADPEEVRLVLKLVKLIADLPNVTYVIAADEQRLRAITSDSFGESREEPFLDKIVQFKVYVPPVKTEKMEELLATSFRRVSQQAGLDPDRNRILLESSPYFPTVTLASRVRTLRDRNRFENAFRLLLLTTDRNNPLNASDAFHLAFLQTFFPDVVQRIRRERVFLTGGEMRKVVYSRDILKKEDSRVRKDYQDKMISQLTETYPADGDLLRELLALMFPYAANGRGDSDVSTDRSLNRIGIEERFDWYFQLNIPEQPITDIEATAILESIKSALNDAGVTGDLRKPIELLQSAITDDPTAGEARLAKVLDRTFSLTREQLYGFARVLVEASTSLSSEEVSLAVHKLASRLSRTGSRTALKWAGVTIDTPVADLLRQEIKTLGDLDRAVFLAVAYTGSPQDGIFLDAEEKVDVAKAGLERIREFIDSGGTLFDVSIEDFPGLLGRWLTLLKVAGDGLEEFRKYAGANLENDDGLAPLLLRFLATHDNEGNITLQEGSGDGTLRSRADQIVGADALFAASRSFIARTSDQLDARSKADPFNLVARAIEIFEKQASSPELQSGS